MEKHVFSMLNVVSEHFAFDPVGKKVEEAEIHA